MADGSQKQSWQQYHRQHARLRLVSKEGHKQLTAEHNRQRSQAGTLSRGSGGSATASGSPGRPSATAAAAGAGAAAERARPKAAAATARDVTVDEHDELVDQLVRLRVKPVLPHITAP
uniref:Uncharacterized protein n=1 Tax=Tetradesmus obliquus TaxID=3088 RepID=A0A383VLS6_TETOB|eukprot:jgi/Sobl393_1/18619/SZX65356.1